MGMQNSKSVKRLLEIVQKQLGRELTTKELASLLTGDNSVLKNKKENLK